MAFTSKGTLGATNDKTAGTSIALTTITTSLSAGDLCVVVVGKDPAAANAGANTNEVTSVTDSVGGNTWTKAYEWENSTAANAGAVCAVYFSVLTNALPTGSVITANFSDSRTASAISAWGYSVASGSSVSVDGTPSGVSAANGLASATVSSLSNVEHLALRALGGEGTSVSTGAGTGWTALSVSGTSGGSGASNIAVNGLWAIKSASTSITSAPTGSSSTLSAIILVAFKEVAGGGADINGSAASTESADTASATGAVQVTGAAVPTDSADTLAAAGTVRVTGVSASVEGADTAAGTGTVGSSTVTGSAALAEAADTASVVGAVTVTGAVASTDASDTASAAGVVLVSGAVASSDSNDTASASGTVRVTSSGALEEGTDSAASAGTVSITGAAALAESSDNLDASGTVASSGVTGSIASTDDADTASAAGSVIVGGAGGLNDSSDAAAASGQIMVAGAGALADVVDTATASGAVLITGTVSANDNDDLATIAGAVEITGYANLAEALDAILVVGRPPPEVPAGRTAIVPANDTEMGVGDRVNQYAAEPIAMTIEARGKRWQG